MKNKITKTFFLIIIFLSFFLKDSYSKDLELTAAKLEILENGNLLVGTGGVKVISDDQTIEAEKFKYNKINLHLDSHTNRSSRKFKPGILPCKTHMIINCQKQHFDHNLILTRCIFKRTFFRCFALTKI